MLDLAALLRVLDQNWNDLSRLTDFSRETRSWLKEAQSIRNRWAHAPAVGLPNDLIYRDLDTIERLCSSLGGLEQYLEAFRTYKKTLLHMIGSSSIAVPIKTEMAQKTTTFSIGDIIALKADPKQTGAVIAVDTSGVEMRYQVFHNGGIQQYFESQLQAVNTPPIEHPVTTAQLNSAMTALQLLHPSTSLLYSLASARINFVPYQFRPVLKLIQAERPRLLIADEVGVGKTIEAGLIIKELQARRELKSVLIICPKPLVAERKWQQEMKRFDERFEHLDGATLRYCLDETHLDGQWPQKYARSIVPYSLLDEELLMGKTGSKKRGLLKLDPPPTFDLVIVDEAHAIRNQDTWAYRNVRYFCDNAQAVVLLSATPIQLGSKDLFTLLHLLRPDIITSVKDFERMSEPNPFINAAIEIARAAKPDWKNKIKLALSQALKTYWGAGVTANSSAFAKAEDLLNNDNESIDTRLSLVRSLEQLYTFAPLISRTRRRDIGNFTTRKPETITVSFTPEQDQLNQRLLELLSRMLAARHGERNLKFMLSTVRRQISSCVFGLAPLLEAMLQRHLSQLELSELGDENDTGNVSELLQLFKTDVQALINQANAISGIDPKFDAFLNVIHDKQRHSNNKLLVFSSFRHTLSYLTTRLNQQPIRYGLIHGDVADDDRRVLRNRFSLSKDDPNALDVLLSSEVGCEGLDYQFCDGMVNYDLPWNPMRVEQRIGRIDRYGQKKRRRRHLQLYHPQHRRCRHLRTLLRAHRRISAIHRRQ
jgi:ATP-dependent helicase HepA